MNPIDPKQLLLWMALIGFFTGVVTLLGGILILTIRVSSKDVRTISNQAATLAQKGLTEDISGIIGNTATLMDSMTTLIQTSAGIGAFLCFLGLLIMTASCSLIIFLPRINL